MTTLAWVISTIGGGGVLAAAAYFSLALAPKATKYIAIAAAAWVAFGAYTVYIRHEATKDALAKVEKEKTDAIAKGTKARERVIELCDSTPARCVPDDWYRD